MAITRPAPIGRAELHGQPADTAGARVHDHALAMRQLGRGAKEMPRGEALDEQGERRLVVEPAGSAEGPAMRGATAYCA